MRFFGGLGLAGWLSASSSFLFLTGLYISY